MSRLKFRTSVYFADRAEYQKLQTKLRKNGWSVSGWLREQARQYLVDTKS